MFSNNHHPDPNIGPIIAIAFDTMNTSDIIFTNTEWIFGSKILSNKRPGEMSRLIEADPTRFSAQSSSINDTDLMMTITNAIKADEGIYTVRLSYNSSDGEMKQINDSVNVKLDSYLPNLDFPRCSIEPDNVTTIHSGVNVTFICIPGDSYPPVNLTLLLERDGSYEVLGDTNATRPITTNDTNIKFICNMSSDTFPTAVRNCSHGPILVRPTPTRATTETSELTSPVLPVLSIDAQRTIIIIIGGAIGTTIVIMIVLTLVIICLEPKRSRPSNDQPSSIGKMVELETNADSETIATPKPKPSISAPFDAVVSFNRASIDLSSSPNALKFDPDCTFPNYTDIEEGDESHQVNTNGSVAPASEHNSGGHASKNKAAASIHTPKDELDSEDYEIMSPGAAAPPPLKYLFTVK